jgi:hypothetical protein
VRGNAARNREERGKRDGIEATVRAVPGVRDVVNILGVA